MNRVLGFGDPVSTAIFASGAFVEHLLVRPQYASKFLFLSTENRMRQLTEPLAAFAWFCLVLCAFCVSATAQTKTATTTALAVTSSGSAVTTIAIGAPITLTATVTAGTTPIKTGQVEFCDATAPHCTDIHLYGTAQLTSAGTATLALHPSVGSYQYKAIFVGTTAFATSTSSTSALSVTGTIPTATAITQSGSVGSYTLAAVVGSTSKSQTGPTGSVSFLDTSNNNAVVTTAALGNTVIGPTLLNVSNPQIDNEPTWTVSGDFNGDGTLDIAAAVGDPTQTVLILLGDGKGNFTPVTKAPITTSGIPTLVRDFNGDGIPDLLLTTPDGGTITILLGNGDGTFRVAAGSPFSSTYGDSPIAAADFNGDGIVDLAAGGGYYMTVWLGNGDGSFTQQPINSSSVVIDDEFLSMVAGDFNGDGIPDLAVLENNFETNVLIYLSNGDGTFRLGSTSTINASDISELPATLAVADFNGDGKLDVVAPSYSPGGVAVLLGNGDGTLQATTQITTEPETNNVAVGDFNGDGIPDIAALADSNETNLEILFGKGDGTFTQTPAESAYVPSFYNIFADFNGDGVTDVLSPGFDVTGAQLLFGELNQSTAAATNVNPSGPGNHFVDASYAGDANFGASTSATTLLLSQALAPTFSPAAGTYPSTQMVSLSDASPDVTIHYTTDGSTPGFYSTLYSGPITVLASETINAIATGTGYNASPIVTAVYAIVPPPQITSLSPSFTSATSAAFTLTLNGTGFVSASTVSFGSTAVSTQYVSATQLTAQIPAAQIATPGIVAVTIQNPTAAGGASAPLQFEIDSAGSNTPPSFTSTTATVAAGSTATYAVILPSSATNVSVTCLNLPAGASCSYTASPGTLTITTTAATPAGTFPIIAVFTETLPGPAAALIALPLLLLPFASLARKRVKPGVLWMVCLGIALTLGAIAGCGGSGGGGGTTPQTHQVTSSATVTLIVQ
jgi:hypothetical protein